MTSIISDGDCLPLSLPMSCSNGSRKGWLADMEGGGNMPVSNILSRKACFYGFWMKIDNEL